MSLTLGRAHTLCSASSLSGCHRFNAGSVFLARHTQLAQRLFSGGQKLGRDWGSGGGEASQPSSKFSVCFNLEESLWPSGDAEGVCDREWGLLCGHETFKTLGRALLCARLVV